MRRGNRTNSFGGIKSSNRSSIYGNSNRTNKYNLIEQVRIDKINANDPEYNCLTLTNKKLSDDDISRVATALSLNTVITSLDLSDSNITDEQLAILLASCHQLSKLKLSSNYITEEGVENLANHPSVKTLDIRLNKIQSKGLVALFANSNLSSLTVSSSLTSTDVFDEVPDEKAEDEVLNFKKKLITSIKDSRLNLLDLKLNYEHPFKLDILHALVQNPSIKSLSLSNMLLKDEDVEILAKNTTVIRFYLSDTKITGKSLISLAGMRLLVLDVSNNCIFTPIREFSAFDKSNKNLTENDKKHNQFALQGLQALATHCNTLKTLIIKNCLIGDSGVKILCSSTSIESLDISDNEIGFNGILALAKNKTLKKVILTNNKWEMNEKSAKILARSSSITSLFIKGSISGMDIDQFESNKKLISLDVMDDNEEVAARIIKNQGFYRKKLKSELLVIFLILALDWAKSDSSSYIRKLPKEVLLYIISFIDFESSYLINKNNQQIYLLANFVFNKIVDIKNSINQKQSFKIIENQDNESIHFNIKFFTPKRKKLEPKQIQEQAEPENNKVQKNDKF